MHRFIYAYVSRDASFVYVGSAFDVATRDYTHSRGRLAIDRELRCCGRNNFKLVVLESVQGVNAADAFLLAIPRENFWMDKLATFRTPHGFNFSRACAVYKNTDAVEAHRAAVKAAKSTVAAVKQASAAARLAHARPAVKARHSAAMLAAYSSLELRARVSATMKKVRSSAQARKTGSNAKAWENATKKASWRCALKNGWTKEARQKKADAMRGNTHAVKAGRG